MSKPRRGAKLPVLCSEPRFFEGGTQGEGYVYIAWEESTPFTGFVKVGRTGEPDARQENLQTGNPRELETRFRGVSDMKSAEEALKDEMIKEGYRHAPGGTEWFRNVSVEDATKVLNRVARRFPRN